MATKARTSTLPTTLGVYPTLVEAYAAAGLRLVGGLDGTRHSGLRQAAFTWLMRGPDLLTDGFGMAVSEIATLQDLVQAQQPSSIFIIGNSYGFSTLALALMAPNAKVLAIDSGTDANSVAGLELTNRLAKQLGLKNVVAVQGTSPADVGPLVKKHLKAPLDLVLIDGLHTNPQLALDGAAVAPFLAPNACVLCHDVLEFGLQSGFAKVLSACGGTGQILTATTSGIGVIWRGKNPALAAVVAAYTPPADAMRGVNGFVAWQKRQRLLRPAQRLWRSVAKRLGLSLPPKPTYHRGQLFESQERK